MILRPYQEESLKAIEVSFKNGINKQLIVLPTGSGKTIVFSALCKKKAVRTLVLAHRDELLRQAHDKIKSYWPEADTGFVNASTSDYHNNIVIGSVQSCYRKERLEKLKEQNFELLIIDEAHHATATTYKKIIDYLGFSFFKHKLMVGVTATPYRENKGVLGDIFQEVVYVQEIQALIDKGYLSPVIARRIRTGIDLSDIKTTSGDFQQDQLAYAVDTTNRNELIVDKYLEHAQDRKGIAFCVNIKHCRSLAQEYNNKGIKAVAVWGAMPPEERKQALTDFKTNKIQILTSCGVLTEGFDEPSINCIVMARPTKSKTLYIQCAGRGLRIHEGKKNCLVLDITDSHHNLQTLIDIKKILPKTPVTTDKTKSELEKEKLEKLQAKEKILHDKEFNIIGSGKHYPNNSDIDLIWIDIGHGQESTVGHRYHQGKRVAEWEWVRTRVSKSTNLYMVEFHRTSEPSLTSAVMYTDKEIDKTVKQAPDIDLNFSNRSAPWFIKAQSEPVTPKQKALLAGLGVKSDGMTKQQATLEINKSFALKRKASRLSNLNSPT